MKPVAEDKRSPRDMEIAMEIRFPGSEAKEGSEANGNQVAGLTTNRWMEPISGSKVVGAI